jgi:hypothetical protein
MCVCVCVCVCVYIHIYIHIYVCVCVCVCVWTYIHVYVYIYYTHTHTHRPSLRSSTPRTFRLTYYSTYLVLNLLGTAPSELSDEATMGLHRATATIPEKSSLLLLYIVNILGHWLSGIFIFICSTHLCYIVCLNVYVYMYIYCVCMCMYVCVCVSVCVCVCSCVREREREREREHIHTYIGLASRASRLGSSKWGGTWFLKSPI